MRRSIVDLCGGFVTVDQEGRVAMIHQTAREFLTRGAEKGRPLVIDVRTTNDALLKRCLAQLTHPSLRSQVKHGRAPALTQYAATAWSHHLTLSSALTNPEILDAVATFLRGPHVLTWIEIAARSKELRALVAASRHLADTLIRLRRRTGMGDESLEDCQAAAVVDGWATDLVKIVGKFGSNLRSKPDSIYQLIPPFCPEESMMYRQFGCKESRLGRLHVSGLTSGTWDDCLARLSLPTGSVASSIITAGGRIALLSVIRTSSEIIIYHSATLEEQRRLLHPERVLMMQANKLGDMLVSYGYKTTRVWDVASGDCLKTIPSPAKRPHSIIFAEKQNTVLVCGEDRRIRSFSLDDDSAVWTVHAEIEEQSVLDDPILNFPICSALSPDGSKVAFGYRNHPLTVWDLEGEIGPERMAYCYGRPDEADMALEQEVWGEVFQVAWHPLGNEVFGLTQVGLLFKWDPDDDYTAADVEAWGKCLAINRDGSLVATGDGVGTIKIFASADFSKLYQLSSKDPVLYLTFSSDSRRLYDVRGLYGTVWEPNTLVRLADCPDHNSDTNSETESLAKVSLLPEHHSARVDRVICLAGQSFGPLYCYGTVGGVVTLGEAGRGVVCELARVSSYMQIKHVVWSGDGRLLAFSDLSGKLTVKRVARSGQQRTTWETSDEFEVKISPKDGNIISQLIFHPAGSKIFAATPVKLFSIDIPSRTVMESPLEPASLKVKWACHPTRSDTLLGFGNAKVHVFRWNDLRQTEVHTYFPLRVGRSSTLSISSAAYALAPSVHNNDTEKLGRLITNTDSPEILLEISSPTPSGQFQSQYLLFDVGNVQLLGEDDPAAGGGGNPRMLPYAVLDPEIASRIREPLAILSRRRLAFLDVDRWVCTWRLPLPSSWSTTTAVGAASRRTSQPGAATTGGVERYYFLPSDWVTGNDTRLCSVTPDGTLLCPRNGDVVTVQTSKLRK
jgi:WD40 repeat protein